jgi:hypothetical protein
VLARRIAEALIDSGAHRISHLGREMCCGIIVKVKFVNHIDLGVRGEKLAF